MKRDLSRIPLAQVALLRGVNLGGKNRLSMRDLALMFSGAGCENVRTYIQSGNVIFSATPDVSLRVCASIPGRITDKFGFQTQLIVRTCGELREVMSCNPFIKAGAAEQTLHVLFLADAPKFSDIEHLDPDRSRPDEFVVLGREIYLSLPNGVARTKLTNSYFDSKLRTVSTGRNWRTVVKLFEMMEHR